MQRSRYYQLGYRLGRLSARLALPSDQRIAAWHLTPRGEPFPRQNERPAQSFGAGPPTIQLRICDGEQLRPSRNVRYPRAQTADAFFDRPRRSAKAPEAPTRETATKPTPEASSKSAPEAAATVESAEAPASVVRIGGIVRIVGVTGVCIDRVTG